MGGRQLTIQWFPGHMAKARREVKARLKQVDIVIELLDARLPLSSRNPMMETILGGKPRLVVLNKCDLADEKVSAAWVRYFEAQHVMAVPIDAQSGKGVERLVPLAAHLMKDKWSRLAQKGIRRRSVRSMVVGIPNVGKSSLINRLAGRQTAKTGNRPGVTKGQQWIKAGKDMHLLDTPGILWPKFDDSTVAMRLAASGAIKDDLLPLEDVALFLLEYLAKRYPHAIANRYQIDAFETEATLLEAVGRKRGCVVSGGAIDVERAADVVLRDFQSGRLGRISLEFPSDWEENRKCPDKE